MSALEAIFFGIIQGLAEFLPISSSGHLAFFHELFEKLGLRQSADSLASGERFTFDILLHLGTLAAVCIVYWRDIWKLLLAFISLVKKVFKNKFRLTKIKLESDEKFLIMLFVALLPLVVGAMIEGAVEAVGNYMLAIGVLWLVNGVILFVSDRIAAKRRSQTLQDSEKKRTVPNALKVGCCQLLAIFPGISRSGMTITGGLLCGFDREFAVKFSFILSIPAIVGANILSIGDISAVSSANIIPYICGMIAAMLSGLLAIKLLNYISKKKDFRAFAIYCLVAGVAAIILNFAI